MAREKTELVKNRKKHWLQRLTWDWVCGSDCTIVCVCVCVCVCTHSPMWFHLGLGREPPPVVDHTQCLFYRAWWAWGRCLDKATSSHYMLVVAARGNRLPDRHDSHFLSRFNPSPTGLQRMIQTLRFECFTPHYGIKARVMSFKRMRTNTWVTSTCDN